MVYTLEWDEAKTIAFLSQSGRVTVKEMEAINIALRQQCEAGTQVVHLIVEFSADCQYDSQMMPLRKFGTLYHHPCMGVSVLIAPPMIVRFFANMLRKWFNAQVFIVASRAEALSLLQTHSSKSSNI